MKIRLFLISLCVCLPLTARAHDRFLKLDNYFPGSGATIVARVFNGTFVSSEKAVPREAMADVSILTPSGSILHPSASDWSDDGPITKLNIRTSEPGLYVLGLYTKKKEIVLPSEKFNKYLDHDGLPDVISARKRDGEMDREARERYSHHAKAIFQVGDAGGDSFKTALGHPVEIIPQQNPVSLKQGQTLEVLCLKDGRPISGQYLTAGVERDGMSRSAPGVRADERGIAAIKLDSAGVWYVKFIHMAKTSEPSLDYESKWATLTFEVKD